MPRPGCIVVRVNGFALATNETEEATVEVKAKTGLFSSIRTALAVSKAIKSLKKSK